jgi:large subunit ribosomal protein L20
MTRVTRGFVARRRRNKVLKLARGFRGGHSRLFRTANQQVMKARKYAYRDRKRKKTEFRQLWIRRINAYVRQVDSTQSYNKFIYNLKQKGILINRKSLAQLATLEPVIFQQLVNLSTT